MVSGSSRRNKSNESWKAKSHFGRQRKTSRCRDSLGIRKANASASNSIRLLVRQLSLYLLASVLPEAVLQAQVGHFYKCSRAIFPCFEAANTRLEFQSSFSGASFHIPWPRHTFKKWKKNAWAHGPQRQPSCLFFKTSQPMVVKTPSRFTQRLVQHLYCSRRTRALLAQLGYDSLCILPKMTCPYHLREIFRSSSPSDNSFRSYVDCNQ